ncbi:substrate-binding domain-containing protein [Nonomuraea sp. NPDC049158]|uniref:substrate-binding domain-containing protein n=1 Tax=Nonomuraea sp. NPDC049158 TaxID=3155649 RepID=UPI003409C240
MAKEIVTWPAGSPRRRSNRGDIMELVFDDLPVAALVDPPLTTVHQPLTEMAAAATEMAPALGRGEGTPRPGLEPATTLTIRRCTAPPAGD